MDLKDYNIQEVFQKLIKIEPKVMAIETMFNNQRRLEKTNYAPPYQRNYVWDNEKATFFLESIILGTEIPPLIFFKTDEKIEVIDGRQRYETIYNFVRQNSKQKLTPSGLWKFNDLKNKKFNDLNKSIKDVFWDTKLRLIEFSFIDENESIQYEEIVKREVFKRYNSGITPLRATEVDKAKYLDNNLNSHFKQNILSDRIVLDDLKQIFHYDKVDIEIILKEIRKIIVLDNIPIKYYSTKKDIIINKFYDFLYGDSEVDVAFIYLNFLKKIGYIDNILRKLKNVETNRLMVECLYWAISVLEKEGIELDLVFSKLKEKESELVNFIEEKVNIYTIERNSFAPQIIERYSTTADFFSELFVIDYENYINNNQEFKDENKKIDKMEITDSSILGKFESLRLNKPDASSITIDDICRQMQRNRFLVRPPYQRNEVINTSKSSAIIESIILGIKLPPIFIYKRLDGVSEVIDGQQRLLSIIGFIGKNYIDEKNRQQLSKKNKFKLNLKNGILKDLDRISFANLPEKVRSKIMDYDLWIIEINQKNNPEFEPIDLYLRLNTKPFPIKENTFEMWNSYVQRNTIDSIKTLQKAHNEWFYLRKNNRRMNNEDLVTSLIYLNFKNSNSYRNLNKIYSFLDIYKTGERIGIRIKSKNDITSILESNEQIVPFKNAVESFFDNFILVLKNLLDKEEFAELSNELDYLIDGANRRTAKNFYALWLLIANSKPEQLYLNKSETKSDIQKIIRMTNEIDSKKAFENHIVEFWEKYNI
ncbi:DUF262 domain-containing protein [Flagellimonas amoyensis]|uniref:DUF262 domain-containing protein n=1 Tax=Flagellimonas amoyensis TaxID=2169401 RepID=UPI000D3712E0|nr:DUF262 domain-containing protein [Allomuricauda amoyensis]